MPHFIIIHSSLTSYKFHRKPPNTMNSYSFLDNIEKMFNDQRESYRMSNANGSSVLRQLSRRHSCSSWPNVRAKVVSVTDSDEKALFDGCEEQEWWWEWEEFQEKKKSKNVVVYVDGSSESRVAVLWALYYLVDVIDKLVLLNVFDYSHSFICKPDMRKLYSKGSQLLDSMNSLCRAHRPEIYVESVIVGGDEKGETIVSQARKLKASILVLGQRRPSILHRLFKMKNKKGKGNRDVVEYCIRNGECLTLGVRKQVHGMGGYIINSRWHKDFWLLA